MKEGVLMLLEKIIETDVLIVGGGLAGTFAAIKASEHGLDVTLVDKGYVSQSGGSAFAGGYYNVFNPEWGHDLDAWMNQITRTGEYILNREWAEIVLKESYERYQDLVSWGVEFAKNDDGSLYTNRQGIIESLMMQRRKYMPIIRKQTLKSGATILDRIMVTDLLKQDGKVVGGVGFHTISGDLYVFKAKATVLATGNSSFKTAPSPIHYWTADGHAMGYKAGAEITGKEFSQGSTGIMADYPSWRGHGYAGVRFRKYITAEGNEVKGRSVDEVHTGNAPIFWNLDAATSEDIKSMQRHRKITDTAFEAERIGFDVSRGGKIPIVGNYFLGNSIHGGTAGILPVNTKCATTIPGLYAAGDACSIRSHGAVYPVMGSAMRNATVTGNRAGLGATEYALKTKKITIDAAELTRVKKIVYAPMERKGGFSPRWVTQQLQNLIIPYYNWEIKHGERMQAVLTLVEFLDSHIIPKLTAKDAHELRLAHETKNMFLHAEMMLRASIFRTESRGTHYREDYPRRDDPNWLAWVYLKEERGRMKLWKEPIPKAWWPDLSKPYEERYTPAFPISNWVNRHLSMVK